MLHHRDMSRRAAGLSVETNFSTDMSGRLASGGRASTNSGETTSEDTSKRKRGTDEGGDSDGGDSTTFFGDEEVYEREEDDVEADGGNGLSGGSAGGSGDKKVDPSQLDWQGRIDLVRKSKNTVKHLGKPRAIRRASIGGKWTTEEDEALRAIVNEHGAKNWKNIARLLGPTRTDVQCLHRWNKVLKPGLHKGAWKQEAFRSRVA